MHLLRYEISASRWAIIITVGISRKAGYAFSTNIGSMLLINIQEYDPQYAVDTAENYRLG